MNPIQPPERIGRKQSRLVLINSPVLVYDGKKPIHVIWHIFKVGWAMITDVDRFFTVSAPELGDVCNSNVIQRPQRVLIERFDALLQANLNAVRQQVVLSEEILLLNPSE